MVQQLPVSEEFLQLVREGLDQAVQLLGDDESFIPFVVTAKAIVMLAETETRAEMVHTACGTTAGGVRAGSHCPCLWRASVY